MYLLTVLYSCRKDPIKNKIHGDKKKSKSKIKYSHVHAKSHSLALHMVPGDFQEKHSALLGGTSKTKQNKSKFNIGINLKDKFVSG